MARRRRRSSRCRQSIETARVQLEQARQTLTRQQDLWRQQLTTREALERAENDVKAAQSALQEREKQLIGQQSQVSAQSSRIAQERATLESARYDLSKVRIDSPIDGIVTRRNIQEGETAVIGTMNNAGTVLLTLADMSVIQAEVEVDETNIPSVQLGQTGRRSRSTRCPTRRSRVTSARSATARFRRRARRRSTATQATNFKVVVILDEPVPDVRPGFTCTADITTATRKERDGRADSGRRRARAGLRRERTDREGAAKPTSAAAPRRRPKPVASAAELKPGQTRKETEGVFVVRDGKAEFVPIKMGIAGDKYFEVLSGLKAGDQVITGPYNSVRGMADGDLVKSGQRATKDRTMNKFLESALIALDAIWASKLRSFMTVLGNIVAVTSIIAVVSLIQGLNASVKTAILNQAGADSFNIQQFPITRSDEEFDKVRNNPRITLADARAIRRYSELASAP